MSSDDIIYLSLLCITIILGHVFRYLKSQEKEVFGSLVGVLIIVFVSGVHSIHPLLATLFTIILLQFCSRRYVHIVCLCVLFSYLLFFRLCHYLPIPMPPAHTNAIQMLLTLKLVGVCFEVHDTWEKREKLRSSELVEEEKGILKLEMKYEEIDPSAVDIFYYAFNYIGVLTGPYYKFRTYSDMIHCSYPRGAPDFLSATVKRMRYIPLYCALFLAFNHFFPLSFTESTEIFRDYSFLYRVLYMTPVFFTFRMRIYSGFALSECACIMAGLGCYPKEAQNRPGRGPSNFSALETLSSGSTVPDYDFETVHNIDEFGSEFAPTVRGGMRSWNMTVQYWLANNIYKRMTFSKALKETITMFVSAFWHGVYSGYYLSMLTVPFILAIEDFYDRFVRKKLSETGRKVYDWVCWVHKMQQFSYMGMAFLLLRVDSTIHYWRSIGFIYHGLIIVLHGAAQYINLIYYKVDKKLAKCRQTSVIGKTKVSFVRHKNKQSDDSIGYGDVIDISDVLVGHKVSESPKQ